MALFTSRDRNPSPLMLKDYLRDDFSSCSSNGFRSFSRRQCCTTIRFLVETDHRKARHNQNNKKHAFMSRSRSRAAASTTISALQRASEAFINAVKQIKLRKVLRRSSKKMVEKEVSEIKRWRLLGEILVKKDVPLDQNSSIKSTTDVSWSSNALFTSVVLDLSNSNYVEQVDDDDSPRMKVGVEIGGSNCMEAAVTTSVTTTSTSSVDSVNKEIWTNEEKEQSSPVCVLDCPFEDDDEEEINSPFSLELVSSEGSKEKAMCKTRRLENLTRLKPVQLEKRIALILSEDKDESLFQSSMEPFSKSQELLGSLKRTVSSEGLHLHAENLLLDFFVEKIVENNGNYIESEVLKEAEKWINDTYGEMVLGWENEESKKGYVKDMQKNASWSNVEEEKELLVMEVEDEVFTSLVNEMFVS